MDELSEKLAGLLNDPDTMERVRQMARGLFSDQSQPSTQQLPSVDMPTADEITKIMSIMSKLNASGDDSRSGLLLALKPHLSEPRREKVDRAVKILKLIELLPLIQEMNGGKLF